MSTTTLTKTKPISLQSLIDYISLLTPIEPVNLINIMHHFNSDLTDLSDSFIGFNGDGFDLREFTNLLEFSVSIDDITNYDHYRITNTLVDYRIDGDNQKLVGYVYQKEIEPIINAAQLEEAQLVTNQTYLKALNQFVNSL